MQRRLFQCPHESPLHNVHSLGRDEGSLSLSELTVLCTNLSNKVISLEAELAQTKQTYGTALTKLIKKVKKLEQTVKSTQARRRIRIVVSDDEEGLEDPSKQGRKFTEIDQDPSISLDLSYDESKSMKVSERAFMTLFSQDNETFTIQASILNVNKMTSVLINSGLALHRQMTSVHINLGLALQRQMASADNTSGPDTSVQDSCKYISFSNNLCTTIQERLDEILFLFQPLFDEYFNPPPCVVSPDPVAVAAPRPVDPAGSPLSTTIDQDVPSASTSPTNQEIQFQVTHQDPSFEETTLQGVIPSNLHHLNQSFDTLTKLTKNHPLENVIGDPSRPVLIRSQLHEHAIWCYFDSNDNPIPFGGKRSG
ncbi:hypothetical protein Tco_0032844 [Tanacetum coccineum]